jgi:hypothetical protein
MTDAAPGPSADDKAHYEALKNDLIKALPKKRRADKQLVRGNRLLLIHASN